ncbi:S-layer homology domain-containing protein [Lawsonibacter sp. JLR.KK007]|uniref:S-layer homology domain-containing protein n=1 Tax=Lawsonibacter sp. JLR.KK007 TaxID=3114293 RepID=UPI002FF055D4
MRNLKRALSLTLASVMLLGMMVVGSSAAVGYPDVAEDDNVEAIEVVQSVGVMVGDENGNFRPGDSVSRAEMAVVMGKLLNLDYNYYSATCPFTDVSGVYDWARGWVGAAAANGIVSGRGDGIYDPAATVTAVEAASMMMRALGYFKYQNDYADGFEVATVRQGTTIGIFEGVGSSATAPMTRNQVAQMVLNALKSGMVQPDGNTINLTTPDGSVLTGKVNYVYVTSNKAYAQAISSVAATSMGSTNDNPIVELGEQLYNGSLKLNEKTMDDFYRPTRTWEFDSKTIGSYVKKELLKAEYTKKVTGRELYDLLSKDVIDNYDFEIAVDGVNTGSAGARNLLTDTDGDNSYFTTGSLVRSNTDGVGRTGNGVLTQVFVDNSKDVEKVYIAVINTYLAIADKDYDAKRDEITLTGYNMYNNGSSASPVYVKDEDKDEKLTVDGEDFDIEDVKKDEKFLVTVADGRVQSMITPEVLSETTINAFKKNDWVNADGTQYNHATTARYDEEVLEFYDNVNMKDVTYNVILDEYGYLIGLELNEKANQYVFITGTDAGESNLYDTNARVNAIFLDGTMETITVDTKKSDVAWNQYGNHSQVNTWCTFTKDSKDVYTLKQVGIDSTVKSAKKVAQSAMDAVAYDKDTAPLGVGEFDINNKNVSLNGSKVKYDGTKPAYNPSGLTGDYTRVYGNDDTVYINAKMEAITVKDGNKPMVIVTDVDSVTTGVKNVDMTVKNHTKTGNKDGAYEMCAENEAYILYNKDGYIIGVVTLAAEDKGVSAKYAYITGDVNKEEYLGNDEWKWTQNAIIDGKVVELTEVDDTRAYLNSTEKGKWYEVRFDAKGNVSGLKENDKIASTSDKDRAALVADGTLKNTDHSIYFDFTKDRFINQMSEVKPAVNGNKTDYEDSKTVLLWVDYCTGVNGKHDSSADRRADLSFKNGTLYTDTAQTEGFSVSPNVNVVLALAAKNHGSAFDDVDDRYTGYTGVEDALKNLDKSADAFDGFLCAVIENGDATSIIFDERAGANRNDLEPVQPMSMIVTQVDEDGTVLGTKSFDWYGGAFKAGDVTAPSGYTFKNAKDASAFVEGKNGTVTFVYTKDKDDETDVPTKTAYVRVTFQTGGTGTTTGPLETKTVPVTVDALGYGTLTADAVEKYVPAGYKLAEPFATDSTAIAPQAGGAAQAFKVQVVERTDVTGLAMVDTAKVGEVEYGTALAGVGSELGTGIKFVVSYGSGNNAATRTIDATDANLTYDDAANGGTAVSTVDGKLVAKYNNVDAATAEVNVKIYATLTIAGANDVAAASFGADKTTAKVFAGDTVTVVFTAAAVGEYSADDLAGATKSVSAAGSTTLGSGTDAPTYVMTHAGLAAATAGDDGKAVITVTFKVTTLDTGTDTVTIDIAK